MAEDSAAPGSYRREAERAVGDVARLLRHQLSELRRERDRLADLLGERANDVSHTKVMIATLGGAVPARSAGARKRVERLRDAEEDLSEAVEILGSAKRSLDSLLGMLASVSGRLEAPSDGWRNGVASAPSGTLEDQEAERARLAREIHDGPAQALANAVMAVEYCEQLFRRRPEAVPAELQRIRVAMLEGLDDVRRFLFDLRPSGIEHDGLCAILGPYSHSWSERFGVELSLECDERADEALEPDQRFAAFRVVQEALQNCRKHADASRVVIALRREAEDVVVSVRDDGRGFDLDRLGLAAERYGLRGMRERARLAGGQLEVRAAPGKGTEILLVLPVRDG